MKSIEELALKVADELNRSDFDCGYIGDIAALEYTRRFLAAYTEQQEPFAHICVLPTADAGPTKFFTSASDPRGFPVFRHAAPIVPDGEVVVTTDEEGRCVAVTRQDEEGRILSVIWEAEQVPADMVLVSREMMTKERCMGIVAFKFSEYEDVARLLYGAGEVKL